MRTILVTSLLAALVVVATRAADEKPANRYADCGRFLDLKTDLGNRTEFDDYPWLALLEYNTPSGQAAACGGVLLNERYVLTAGHCVTNLGGSWVLDSVRLGEFDTSTPLDCVSEGDRDNTTYCMPAALSVKVEKQIVHESFGGSVPGYDLALLRLAQAVNFTEFIRPICLPSKPSISQKYYVAGWGKLAGRQDTNLKYKSTLTLADKAECKKAYLKEKVLVANDQFCVGGQSKEQACIASSGGPLMGIEKMDDGIHRTPKTVIL